MSAATRPSPLLAERFAARPAERPDATAVVAAGETVTYGSLAARAAATGRAVAGMRRIALLARADADSLAVALGAMAVGTSVVLLHRHLAEEQLARVLAVAAPALVVASEARGGPLRRLAGATPVRPAAQLTAAGWPVAPPGPPALAPSAAASDELLVALTSGTSGAPKLVVRDQASWAATLDRSDAALAVGPGDRVAAPGALDHTHFLYGALHALTRGAAVDLRPVRDSFAPGTATTHAYLVPALAVGLVETLGARPYPALREVLSSAAPWPPQARAGLARLAPNAAIAHFYGASELSFVTLDSTRAPAPPGSAGRPFPGVEVAIRDADGEPLPDGEPGTVHVRSDMLFAGVLVAPGAPPVGGPDADGWATVGDLGTMRDGALWLAGRESDTILSGGLNVEPAEVEAALATLPGVAGVACVGLPDERWGALPVAVLVPDGGGAGLPTRAAVRAHVRAALPAPSRPRRVFVASALPLSPRGKLRRAELAAQVRAGALRELA